MSGAGAGLPNAETEFDFPRPENHGGWGDFLNDEAANGVALLQVQSLLGIEKADLGGAAIGIGMPGGAQDRDIGDCSTFVFFDRGGGRLVGRLGAGLRLHFVRGLSGRFHWRVCGRAHGRLG